MADAVAPTIRTFQVFPDLPHALEPLLEMAHNLWWVWNPDAVELFRRLDRKLWEDVYHNPVKMLGVIAQAKLAAAATDEGYLAHLNRVHAAFKEHLAGKRMVQRAHAENSKLLVAYFSAEFGLHESLPIYSGGLGILAGDHLKSASELGLPLVGVGLLYRNGYFQQYLSADGWQQEAYPELDFYNLPIEPMRLRRRLAGARAGGYAGQRGVLQGVAGERRPRSRFICWTPTCRKTPRPIATSPAKLYGARHRDAHQAGNRAGHRRRSRPDRAEHHAHRLPHERRAQRLPGPGAHSHHAGSDRRSPSTKSASR